LAQQAIEIDPSMAFNLAERSLADGISYSLQSVLTDLRKKDANLANRLFDLALTRFTCDVTVISEAIILFGYLFRPGSMLIANPALHKFSVEMERSLEYANFLNICVKPGQVNICPF
jgi:hypothetical protein